MVQIVYTKHLKLRLQVRKIPEEYPQKIYAAPEQVFFDNVAGNSIAVKKLYYAGKERNMMVAYEEKETETKIITIHPIDDEKIVKRQINGRWIKK